MILAEMKWRSDLSGHCCCSLICPCGRWWGGINSPYDMVAEWLKSKALIWFPFIWDGGWINEKQQWKTCLAFCFTGVAEQFALAEAAMNVWSMNDCIDQPSTSLQGLSARKASFSRSVWTVLRVLRFHYLWIHTGRQHRVRHFCWIPLWSHW